MDIYKKPALTVQALCLVIMAFATVLTVTHWLYPSIYQVVCASTTGDMSPKFSVDSLSYVQKWIGFALESIGLGLLVYGLTLVIRLMSYIKTKDYFFTQYSVCIKKITKISLLYVLYAPLCGALLTIVGTLHNKQGERMISLSFGSSDVFNIMIFCCMLLLTALVKKGYELKHEHELTI